jgi:hypothetical protein
MSHVHVLHVCQASWGEGLRAAKQTWHTCDLLHDLTGRSNKIKASRPPMLTMIRQKLHPSCAPAACSRHRRSKPNKSQSSKKSLCTVTASARNLRAYSGQLSGSGVCDHRSEESARSSPGCQRHQACVKAGAARTVCAEEYTARTRLSHSF